MDEQTPAPEPTPAPQPSAPSVSSAPMGGTTGGPVPFSSAPDPSVPAEERTHALLSWVLSFVIGFISPLIFFLISKDKPFVKHHAATGLTMVIVGFCAGVAMGILGFILAFAGPLVLLMIPIYILVGLFFLAVLIMGAIAGNAGSRFDPPVIGKFRDAIFKV
jgi:uncharacterized membrane protein